MVVLRLNLGPMTSQASKSFCIAMVLSALPTQLLFLSQPWEGGSRMGREATGATQGGKVNSNKIWAYATPHCLWLARTPKANAAKPRLFLPSRPQLPFLTPAISPCAASQRTYSQSSGTTETLGPPCGLERPRKCPRAKGRGSGHSGQGLRVRNHTLQGRVGRGLE